MKINVNISARQFIQNDLVASVKDVLAETGIAPHLLKIELTESAIMEGGSFAIEKLNNLKKTGVQLAIDDFGTGYSSLSSLQQFPIDDIKIDRAFIYNVEKSMDNREIVKTIVSLGKILDLNIVAEGIETKAQLAVVESMECDAVQGFLFSGPVDPQEVERLLQNGVNTMEK